MPRILILHDPAESRLSERLRADLERRGWSVFTGGFGQGFTTSDHWRDPATRIVSLVPSAKSPERHGRAVAAIELLTREKSGSAELVLVVDRDTDLPSWASTGAVYATLVWDSTLYDRFFEVLFRTLLGPWPEHLDVRVRPTQVQQPSGVAWWSQELFVADENLEQVVRIGPDSESVFLPGLTEPYHVDIDRRKLLVANKGADELLLADVTAGMATRVRSVTACGADLASPHEVHQAMGLAAVADSDNHSVRVTSDDLWRVANPSWREFSDTKRPFRYPCGVHVDGQRVWVVDTFNNRLVWFSHQGQVLGRYDETSDPLCFPVCVRSWKNYVFVAEEESKQLRVFRLDETLEQERLEVVENGFCEPWIRSPCGLSINRENRLAVADRDRACFWLVDLDVVFKGVALGAAS